MRYCLLAIVVAVGIHSTSTAQEPVKLPDEYRTIVCDAAVDVASPLHDLALRVIEKQDFRDPKFDAFIRQTLASGDQETLVTDAQMETVKRLMPYCTIPNDERVRLLLDQLVASPNAQNVFYGSSGSAIDLTNRDFVPARIITIAKLLQLHQVELRAELKKRLDFDQPHPILVGAVNLLNIGGQGLLPLLMKAAKSDDERLQYAAIDAINQLQLDRSDLDSGPQASRRRDTVNRMAESMIHHSDKNGDARLDASEWNNPLTPISQVDSNQDGFVTAEEYGRWVESRQRRR